MRAAAGFAVIGLSEHLAGEVRLKAALKPTADRFLPENPLSSLFPLWAQAATPPMRLSKTLESGTRITFKNYSA